MNLHSGYPYSMIRHGLPYDYPRLEQNLSTEVVIMGGGISGALAAYYLIKAGVDCILIDRRTIGLGSTCSSTSLLQYEIDTPLSKLAAKIGEASAGAAYRLCGDAIYKLADIAKEINCADFQWKPSLYFAASEKDVELLKEEFKVRKKYGFKVDYLSASEVSKKFHFEAPGAILSELGAQTNAYVLTHCLLQYLKTKGLKVFDRTAAQTIKHTRNSVSIVTESGLKLKAKKLVYATGYEAVGSIDKKVVRLESTYTCISEQANEKTRFWKDDALIWNTANPYFYMRTTDDHRMLIGGRDSKFYDPIRRDRLLKQKARDLVKDFNTLYPDMPFKPEFSWAGTFGSTEDGLPFIGEYEKLPNSLFALGFGGNGITFSLIAAEMITGLVTGNPTKESGIFSFNRS